jgi:pimeloyl-ACP methyl ester carboxylesterase
MTSAAAPAPVERHMHRVGAQHLHYRAAGRADAPRLVLLHPSPRSSAMFEPWMQMLAPDFRVFAIDTPGYGASDPLPTPPAVMADYVPVLHQLLAAVAGPHFMLYGSATGAQLALAYAQLHGPSIGHLLLDNAAHFDDDERQHILAHYFPDLSPQADGSHLATAWRMALQQQNFFPWFATDAAHRISSAAPDLLAAQVAMTELLAAGPAYATAYRAAFLHEHAKHVMALTVPTTLLRWQGSVLLRHIDRLLSFKLPPQLQVLQVPAPLLERYAVMTSHLHSLLN